MLFVSSCVDRDFEVAAFMSDFARPLGPSLRSYFPISQSSIDLIQGGSSELSISTPCRGQQGRVGVASGPTGPLLCRLIMVPRRQVQ